MNLAAWSALGLVSLVIVSHITTFAFHILSDRFYAFFHLAAGILAAFFFFSITLSFIASIALTILLGVLWEVFEWYQWKLLIKKNKFKPSPADTRNDLAVDFVGSLIGVAILAFWLV